LDALAVVAGAADGLGFSGAATFFSTPPGSVTLTATVPGVGQVSQESVGTAPDTIVQVGMPPTP
jgi:hypothetical protein